MLKTLLGAHFKEVSSDVLFAEYSREEGSLRQYFEMCAFRRAACSFVAVQVLPLDGF